MYTKILSRRLSDFLTGESVMLCQNNFKFLLDDSTEKCPAKINLAGHLNPILLSL